MTTKRPVSIDEGETQDLSKKPKLTPSLETIPNEIKNHIISIVSPPCDHFRLSDHPNRRDDPLSDIVALGLVNRSWNELVRDYRYNSTISAKTKDPKETEEETRTQVYRWYDYQDDKRPDISCIGRISRVIYKGGPILRRYEINTRDASIEATRHALAHLSTTPDWMSPHVVIALVVSPLASHQISSDEMFRLARWGQDPRDEGLHVTHTVGENWERAYRLMFEKPSISLWKKYGSLFNEFIFGVDERGCKLDPCPPALANPCGARIELDLRGMLCPLKRIDFSDRAHITWPHIFAVALESKAWSSRLLILHESFQINLNKRRRHFRVNNSEIGSDGGTESGFIDLDDSDSEVDEDDGADDDDGSYIDGEDIISCRLVD